MRHWLHIIFLLFGISLCGCVTADSSIKAVPADSGVAYVHPYSKFRFPEQIGRFHFVGVNQYDRDGRDISVGYDNPMPIVATVYVYPAAKNVALLPGPKLPAVSESLIEHEFKGREKEIRHFHPDARLISEEAFQITQGDNHFIGQKAVFSLDYRFGLFDRNSLSELYIFLLEPNVMFLVNDREFVEYRITYPADVKEQAEKEINSFLTKLKWPTK